MTPHLILVHLGTSWFDHIVDCLEQALLVNADAQVWLVASRVHARWLPPCIRERVRFVAVESLARTPRHARFLRTSRLDAKFRGGFWKFAVERFFVIEALMEERGLPHSFHCENDNLLFTPLSELLATMQAHYPGIAATFDNDDRCIPGFMYFGSLEAASSLAAFLAERCTQSHSADMALIARYRSMSERSRIDSLPVVPYGYRCDWTTPSGLRAQHPQLYANNAAAFGSVFDAAAIGQFLGGIDPRNCDGRPSVGFINESCVFDPSRFEYVWRDVGGLSRVPFIRHEGRLFRINNLHLHSKRLRPFMSTACTGVR